MSLLLQPRPVQVSSIFTIFTILLLLLLLLPFLSFPSTANATAIAIANANANANANEHDNPNTIVLSHLRDHAELLRRNYCLTCFSIISDNELNNSDGLLTNEEKELKRGLMSDAGASTNANTDSTTDLGEIVIMAHFRALLDSIARDRYGGGDIPPEAYLQECTILVRGFLTDVLRSQASGAIPFPHQNHQNQQQQQQQQHQSEQSPPPNELDVLGELGLELGLDHPANGKHQDQNQDQDQMGRGHGHGHGVDSHDQDQDRDHDHYDYDNNHSSGLPPGSSLSGSSSGSASAYDIQQSATWQLIKETHDDDRQMYSCAREYREIFS